MKYRSRSEIIASILRSVRGGNTKTRIMYDAYLSYTQLKEYITHLEEINLIARNKTDNQYTLTENGQKFLAAYDQLLELVPAKSGTSSNGFLI